MLNKVAIITGASKGIGRQTALAFAKAGYNTVITATNQPALENLRNEIIQNYSTQCLTAAGDMANMEFVQSLPNSALEAFERIDVLVNNAAWRTIETMRSIDLETWERTMRICLTAPAFLAKICASIMEDKKIQGTIINVSSVMSQQAGGNSPAYIACKGALESLTRELAITYGRSGIRAISIRPGFIDTEMSNDYTNEAGDNISRKIGRELLDRIPANRPGTALDIANAILWLSSAEAGYISGCELTIDGGLSQNFSSYTIKNLQFPNEY